MIEMPTEGEPAKVVHGDCLALTPPLDNAAHLVVTSPPYFNARDYSQWPTFRDYSEWSRSVLEMTIRALLPGRMLCIVVSSVITPRRSRGSRSERHNIPAMFAGHLSDLGAWFAEELVWEKPEGAAINRSQRFSLDRHPMQWRANPNTERILIYQKPTPGLNDEIIKRYGGRDRVQGEWERGEVWRVSPTNFPGHPAAYPVEIPQRLIQFYSWGQDVVFDPFGGSGTTAVAAIKEGRRSIIIEKDEAYCQLARSRIAEAMGQGSGSLFAGT